MGVWQPDKEEPIKVVAWFDPYQPICKRVLCLKFLWNGRAHLIREIDLYHQAERGKNLMHYFSVAEGPFHYKIRFDSKRLLWVLDGVYEDG